MTKVHPKKKWFKNDALYAAMNGANQEEIIKTLTEIQCPTDIAKELSEEVTTNKKSVIWFYAKRPIIGGIILILCAIIPLLLGSVTYSVGALLFGIISLIIGFFRLIRGKLPYENNKK